MPDVKDMHLRIYCICGQKMKVSKKMYGLPGKCIACRQKIRIPTREQVPEGATEIYIKDHPELLRGPRRHIDQDAQEREAQKALDAAKVRRDLDDDSTPITELDLADASPTPLKRETGATLPIDVLEPLRKLCSFRYKIERQIFALNEYHHDDKALIAEVKGHLARVARLRTELDDHLHQLLMEVAIELTNTHEKIAQERLSARVGEISFDEYQDRIYRLRARRERLERRQLNLRGWIATQDPYVAGGFLDLSIDTIPEEGARIELPSEQDDGRPLLTAYVASLKEAFGRRARAEQKLDEAERLAFDEEDEESLDEAKLECQMEKRMARAEVRFLLDRLERLKRDYTGDVETVNAQMEAARDRLKVDEISRQQYDDTEQRLLRAKKDLAKARSVAARALIANTTSDIPQPGGTFLERLGFRGENETTPDIWLGWLSALALCAGLFLPLIGDASLVRVLIENQALSGVAAFAILVPGAVAIAVAAATRLRNDVTRGLALLAIWAAGICLAAYGLSQAFNSLDPLAARFRAGNAWEFRPGVWMMGSGLAGIAAAALAALWSSQKFRPLAVTAIVLGVAVLGFVPSDFLGLVAPRPAVEIVLEDAAEGPERAGSIHVTNLGRRALHLVSRPTSARGSYFFVIERRVGENSWFEIGEDATVGTSADPAGLLRTIAHGETHSVPFSLLPGEYRVLLLADASGTELVKRFTVEQSETLKPSSETPPAPLGVPKPDDLLPALQEEIQPAPAPRPQVAPPLPSLIEVELRGVMTGPDGETRFSLVLYLPDGRENAMMLSLGDTLWGEWNIAEYNPSYRTVTLQRDEKLLILRRGQRNDLPF